VSRQGDDPLRRGLGGAIAEPAPGGQQSRNDFGFDRAPQSGGMRVDRCFRPTAVRDTRVSRMSLAAEGLSRVAPVVGAHGSPHPILVLCGHDACGAALGTSPLPSSFFAFQLHHHPDTDRKQNREF